VGRAIVLQNKKRAYYKIKVIKDAGISENRIATINQLLINYESIINQLKSQYEALVIEEIAKLTTYETVVMRYQAGLETPETVINAKKNLLLVREKMQSNLDEQAMLQFRMIALTKEKEILEKAMSDEVLNIWCVDYTDTLQANDEVGLIELDGDFKWINIAPNGDKSKSKGTMQPCACSTPAGTFLNLALMPCWQRWKPLCRAGIITSINYKASLCNLLLDNPNYSSATDICKGELLTAREKQVLINPVTDIGETPLWSVPIRYMGGNSQIFIEGDHVIVEFENREWQRPVVIGFHDNPRPPLDVVLIRIDDVTVDEATFGEFVDGRISWLTKMIDYCDELINVFAPEIIDAIYSLVGKLAAFGMAGGLIYSEQYWTEKLVEDFVNYWKEMIGQETTWDERLFFRVNAVEYKAICENTRSTFYTLKSIQPYLAAWTTVSFTGHSFPAYDITNSIEGVKLYFEVLRIDDDVLSRINAIQESTEWKRQRELSIVAEELWNKYASTKYFCVGNKANGKISYNPFTVEEKHRALKAGEEIKVIKNENYELAFPNELEPDGIYTVAQALSDYDFMLFDHDNKLIKSFSCPDEYSSGVVFDAIRGATKHHLKVESKYSYLNIATMELDCIALMDKNGELLILSNNVTFDSNVVEISMRSVFNLSLKKGTGKAQTFASYPANIGHRLVNFNIKNMGFDEALDISLEMSIDTYQPVEPKSFGGHYELTSDEVDSLWGLKITVYGIKWWADDLSFMQGWSVNEEDYQNYYRALPSGFYWFASKYFDHPIITGIDDKNYKLNLTEEQEDAIVTYVNQYVNEHYIYRKDFGEEWEFMGDTMKRGDCEDFALTKIDMCLKMGVSIRHFQFMYGYTPVVWANGSGHAWVLYKGRHVLDISSNSFLTVDDMIAKGYIRLGGQVSGLKWWYNNTRDVNDSPINMTVTFPKSKLWPYQSLKGALFGASGKLIKLMAKKE